MGLIDKIRSIFGGGSTASGSAPSSEAEEPEADAEPDTEAEEPEAPEEPEAEEAEETEEEEEDDGDMSTTAVAEMADPRRREGEDNTVHNRAENPTDHAEAEDSEAGAEGSEDEAEEEEDDGGMSTKDVAGMADPRRREDEDNTVHNRAENPADHAEPEEVEEAEAEEAEADEGEEEDDGGMSTKDVAEMADPRRREGEDNTVHNRAENPDDQRAT